MAVRIIAIEPAQDVGPTEERAIQAHIAIQRFQWRNEQTMQTGTSSHAIMFDWIVNKKGRAYVRDGDNVINVYGTIAPTGQQYIRCLRDNQWSNELLGLPGI